jgi:DNA-binding CsgD family transcriptional regulator
LQFPRKQVQAINRGIEGASHYNGRFAIGVGELIIGFESATTLSDLQIKMQAAIESFGFSAYNFFDAGRPHLDTPLYFGTTGEAWEHEYKSNGFVHHDPTLSHARRTNIGFTWSEVSLPLKVGKKKSAAYLLMDAAHDHDFKDGYILPFHFVDAQGRNHSALSALFWKDEASRLAFMLSKERRYELNIVLLYWTQRVLKLIADNYRNRAVFNELPGDFQSLTDREREVLQWAGRGRTVTDTSDLLKIKPETVKTHVINAIEKLGAVNKTHAVAKALQLGLIDL